MTKHNIIFFTAALVLSLLTACSPESLNGESGETGGPAQIIGSIGSAPVVETKAAVGNGDKISYESFVSNDAIGFFSTTGLEAVNAELTYNGHSFQRPDGADALIWKEGVAQKVYAYYPYTLISLPVTGSEYPVSIWRSAKTDKWNKGFEDFLAASGNNVPNGSLISLSFSHQFAMLIIKRGQGFETNTSDIKVRLNYPVAHTANIYWHDKSTTLRLQVDETSGTDELTANKGTYAPVGSSGTGEDCAYVIIPVGEIYKAGVKQNTPLTVVSVVLQNNAGNEVTVPFALSSGAFKENTKYLVTVKMRDNGAVIEPEEIRRWEDESIVVEEPVGIKTAENFEEWFSAYNTSSPDRMNILSRYGTYNDGQWTFLLLNDITYTAPLSNSVITSLQNGDVFDGQGHTISGLSLTNSASTGFFRQLYGEVKNLKLHNIRVVETGTSPTESFGALAGMVMSTGKISNCHVTGDASFVMGAGNIGGLVGCLEAGGSITDCTSTAVVRGTDAGTTGLLVGKDEGGTVTDCISTGTLITNN